MDYPKQGTSSPELKPYFGFVTVTHPDGTTEEIPPYSPSELRKVLIDWKRS